MNIARQRKQIVFLFTLGASFLLPWNAYINAVDYFTYLYPGQPVNCVFYNVAGFQQPRRPRTVVHNDGDQLDFIKVFQHLWSNPMIMPLLRPSLHYRCFREGCPVSEEMDEILKNVSLR
ncbi:Equilibrative nucleotide transporter 1 [Acorus calamus]|uniref:Equilibrative nucleotide transporter 1 n=1 Tax=Acorus calamus TaxID=4465 RepID=A0AAV9BYM3_ACOCL|nr:Equilibrative nucleotide transporter 1 [Acorus calamus]